MRKDQQEALRRLEEALLEQETPPARDDSDQWLEEFYTEPAHDYTAYNADRTDVDMDVYSREVEAGRRRSGCLVWTAVILTAVLCALIGFLLWKQGVIPWA